MFDFPNTQETDEAKLRTRMYQEQAQREGAMAAEVDYPAMMRSLGLWYRIGECTEKQLDRVVELINRTNQFNTTTIRYSKAKIIEFMAKSTTHVLFGEMGDKFGSLGIVAVIILVEQESADGAAEILIDSFVMSCRAMGFNFEHELLSCAENKAKELGKTKLIGRYVPSERNSPCSKVFEQVGFASTGGNDCVMELVDRKQITRIEWFKQG